MKYIPNGLSVLRIILAIGLIFVEPFAVSFYILYLICGASDVLDGFLARKLKSESILGEQLDSIADIVFFAVCYIKLLLIFTVNVGIITWVAVIALFKVTNIAVVSMSKKRFSVTHSKLNKITGVLLFLLPLVLGFTNTFLFGTVEYITNINILAIPVCLVATVSMVIDWATEN